MIRKTATTGEDVMLEFDEDIARILEAGYLGADVKMRRRASFDALRPAPGDHIVDLGCGNGLLTEELARAVGETGRIIGVDPSDDMRRGAVARCAEFEWADIREGTDSALPLESASVDKAVSVQVFEYLADMAGAVREVHRVLRPGGLLVVGDIHFDSVVWHSDDPDRMQRMFDAWDGHFVERKVPALLPPILRSSGFAVEDIRPLTICDHRLRPDGLARTMMILMSDFAVRSGAMEAEDAQAWVNEQEALAKAGRFFFSLTHFVVVARKSGDAAAGP